MSNPYIIVEASTRSNLEVFVNDKVGAGYEPVGGITVIKNPYGFDQYYQTMFKRPSTEPTKHHDI